MAGQSQNALGNYFKHSSAGTQSAVLALPLLLFYGAGITLVPEARNGVDLISSALSSLMAHVANPTLVYVSFYGALAIADVGAFLWLRRQNRLNPQWLVPLLAECLVYAFITGLLSSMATRSVLGLATDPQAPRHFGLIAGLIVSAGAGLHEELFFRLGGVGLVGLLWLGKDWQKPSLRLVALVCVSSVVFSLAHYLGEPFALTSFVFRTVSGMLFATLFLTRGFAVAAWTHALYDAWVIVVMGK
jgi:hypothetical protein